VSELQQFVAELLEERGAAVEPVEPEGLDVLAPPDVRETLGLPEIARLGFAAELPPGARRVGLEPDWLDRLGRLLGERGRSSRLVIEQDLPALSSPERMVEHALQLQNATWRLVGVRPAWTRYLLLTFRCTALSDEKRDSVLRLGINLANGSTLDGMLDRLWQHLEEPGIEPGRAPGATHETGWRDLTIYWGVTVLSLSMKGEWRCRSRNWSSIFQRSRIPGVPARSIIG
jgi:hypothetical protein